WVTVVHRTRTAAVIVSEIMAIGVAIPPVRAQPLTALAHAAVYDPLAQAVTFSITFNRPPDFYTLDGVGRQADSFQFYLFTRSEPGINRQGNTIVRGEEIHIGGDVRFRNDMLVGDGSPE